MVRKQLKAFLPQDAARIMQATEIVLGSPGRPIKTPPGKYIAPPHGIRFRNDSGESMPAWAVGAITGYETADDENYFFAVVEKPGTTLRRQHVINTSPAAIEDGEYGFCEFSDTYRIAHDTSWAPATGESGGPKPGSWLLWKGYPAICNVIGRANAARYLLLGTLSPITTLLCKATADLSSGAVSSNYKIWKGTIASGADSGFTTLPSIELQSDKETDDYFVAHWINNGWVSPAGGGGGGTDSHELGKADSAISSGASGTISIYTGTPGSETDSTTNVTAFNRTSATIPSGGWAHVVTINGNRYAEPWSC